MQPPKSETCVTCGLRLAETVDHVPPKGFFRGVVNAQLRTVPACHTCNNGASSDDEDVRFFISAQIGKQNPASKKLWENGAHKTILRKTKLREAFVATAGEVVVVDKDGAHTTKIAFRVPVNTYQRVFERTTRGLYFFHMGRILRRAYLYRSPCWLELRIWRRKRFEYLTWRLSETAHLYIAMEQRLRTSTVVSGSMNFTTRIGQWLRQVL